VDFDELDDTTRGYMLREFLLEEAGRPYRSPILSSAGSAAFPVLMRAAIETGNEQTLGGALAQRTFWLEEKPYNLRGVQRWRRVNREQAATRLAVTEFTTWHATGLSARLIDEGVALCQVYRAGQPKWEPAACSAHEGLLLPAQAVHDGHRIHYWPLPGNPDALSVPFGPSCHHTIRRTAMDARS
jgi:hypothetical protein